MTTTDRPVFSGGRTLILSGVVASILGLGLTALRGLGDAHVALSAYLVAFAYWVGLTLGALTLLMAFHAAKARWMVVVRRPLEAMAAAVVAAPLLFLPIALGMRVLFPWAGPVATLDEDELRLVHHRAAYLNPTFFLARAAIYFGVWIAFSALFFYWSTRQDESGAARLTVKAWRLGAGGLPALGFTLTFAALDWLMSLGVKWYSTIWGVYFFAGCFVSAIALLILGAFALSRTPALDGVVRAPHWLSLGNLLLAFTCFWGYIAFAQYMLGWIGNLPETIPWMVLRQNHAWRWVGGALLAGQFAVPFLLLLPRGRKMDPRRVAPVAAWILAVHFLDLYWLVMPEVRPDSIVPDWSNLTAFVGVGGAVVASSVALLRGRYALPVRDPFLRESLAYAKLQ